MMENPKYPVSGLHFGKFPGSAALCPTTTRLWIKEVEIAKSVDMTSQSIEGQDFTGFEMLDAKIAFCTEDDL